MNATEARAAAKQGEVDTILAAIKQRTESGHCFLDLFDDLDVGIYRRDFVYDDGTLAILRAEPYRYTIQEMNQRGTCDVYHRIKW